MIPTGRQIREARALLGLTQNALATQVRMVATATITRAELVDGEPPITIAQAAAIRSFFEATGVEFVAEPDGGACVRLRKVPPAAPTEADGQP
jgi:transcriptional regulator with XRE-family HTH domain